MLISLYEEGPEKSSPLFLKLTFGDAPEPIMVRSCLQWNLCSQFNAADSVALIKAFTCKLRDIQQCEEKRSDSNWLFGLSLIIPVGSVYSICTCSWLIFMVNASKYGIHGSYEIETHRVDLVPRGQEGDLIQQLSLQSQKFLCVSESCILIFPTVETVWRASIELVWLRGCFAQKGRACIGDSRYLRNLVGNW